MTRSFPWVARCVAPAVGADETRRHGHRWLVRDMAFRGPRGWALGPLRMWVAQGEGEGEGGRRLLVRPALHPLIAATAGNDGRADRWRPPTGVPSDAVRADLR